MSGSIPGGAKGSQIGGGIGDLIGGFGSFQEGKDIGKMGNYNATIYEQQAASERANQKLLEYKKRKTYDAQLGTQTAMVGKSGIKMSGSPLQVQLDSMANANLDLAIDKYNSDVKANSYQNEANMTRYEAKQAKKKAYTQGALSVLSGAVKIGTGMGVI
jgi:hypothetical protein